MRRSNGEIVSRRLSVAPSHRQRKMKGEIKVFIADDHPIFRSGLSQLLNLEENIEIVGEAENGKTGFGDDS